MQMTSKTLAPLCFLLGLGCLYGVSCSAQNSAQSTQRVDKAIQESNLPWKAENWVVEQVAGGSVAFKNDHMEVVDKGGCTVWLKERLKAPVHIRFKARLVSNGGPLDRVSDLNCFWMATQTGGKDGGSIFGMQHHRTGAFADYDSLSTYYVGMGGNTNTSTRFRRYAGNGERPLLPEHDLKGPQVLLEGNRDYLIEIESTEHGIRYLRDGVVLFDWTDPRPLTEGYFGFRTVWSHLEIRDFRVEH